MIKYLKLIYQFPLYILYVILTLEDRTNYMVGEEKGYHVEKSRDVSLFIPGSTTEYTFNRNKKPEKQYATWKEFWKQRRWYKEFNTSKTVSSIGKQFIPADATTYYHGSCSKLEGVYKKEILLRINMPADQSVYVNALIIPKGAELFIEQNGGTPEKIEYKYDGNTLKIKTPIFTENPNYIAVGYKIKQNDRT